MQKEVSISLKDSPEVVCDKCQNKYFEEVTMFRKVSKLLTGASNDTFVPIPTYRCTECKHVNKELNPFEENE